MEALAEQYARRKLPERILDKKAEELSVKLQLTEEEIARITTQMQIPLTDERIASLVAFSEDYQQRLPTLKQTFAGRRGVIEDLDVTVQLVLRDDEVWLKLKSVLHPKGRLWPLNQGFDRRTIPPEPDRYKMRPAVGPHRAKPDDRLGAQALVDLSVPWPGKIKYRHWSSSIS